MTELYEEPGYSPMTFTSKTRLFYRLSLIGFIAQEDVKQNVWFGTVWAQ